MLLIEYNENMTFSNQQDADNTILVGSLKCKYQKSDKTHLKKLEKEEQIKLIFRYENIVLILKVALVYFI